MQITDVLIVGAGHGGVTAAGELRRSGFAGSITLVNGESSTPYHRPPLSKAWLKGEADEASSWLHPPGWPESQGIDVLSGVRVESFDAVRRTAVLDDGRTIGFAHAVLATGALARALPGAAAVSPLILRDAGDARALKDRLVPGARLAIIGGGFIGLEVAATARHLGAEVTVIEREARLLARLASPPLSAHLADLHRARGVDVLLSTEVDGYAQADGNAVEISVAGQPARTFDLVLAAIGAVPDDRLARAAGLDVDNGVLVDDLGRTSAPGVYAIGDASRRPLPPFAASVRLESVHNATEQARIVAAAIAGTAVPAVTTPWFWSDQYDAKLQIAGLLPSEVDVEVAGDPATGSFALLHRVDGRLRCVEAVNSSREFALGRRRIQEDAAE